MSKLDVMFRAELAMVHEQPDSFWALDSDDGDLLHEYHHFHPTFDSDSFDPTTASEFDALSSSGLGSSSIGSPPSERFDPPQSSIISSSSPPSSEQWPSDGNGFGIFPTYRAATGSGSPLDADIIVSIPLTNPIHHHHHSPPPLPHLSPDDPPRTVHMSDVDMGSASFPGARPLHHQLVCPDMSSSRHTPHRHHSGEATAGEGDDAELELIYPSDSEFPATFMVSTPSHLDGTTPPSPPPVRPSRRKPRAMTKVPVPIPNLTKKSRGRKVPVSNGEPIYAHSKDKTKKGVRTYTCHVEGCGKCFVRGEHLKRHIRSIHTDEKPWQCTYAGCDRAFSRRDNLNQHLRVHSMAEGTSRDSPMM
ncbi:hypothetical protein F5I97DRAFT_1138229 [Phlebopus sp. FC_14]|nr:hypothetical protein F5I97DRAFT_1138229 [Phlebopus sp. FC_14]